MMNPSFSRAKSRRNKTLLSGFKGKVSHLNEITRHHREEEARKAGKPLPTTPGLGDLLFDDRRGMGGPPQRINLLEAEAGGLRCVFETGDQRIKIEVAAGIPKRGLESHGGQKGQRPSKWNAAGKAARPFELCPSAF